MWVLAFWHAAKSTSAPLSRLYRTASVALRGKHDTQRSTSRTTAHKHGTNQLLAESHYVWKSHSKRWADNCPPTQRIKNRSKRRMNIVTYSHTHQATQSTTPNEWPYWSVSAWSVNEQQLTRVPCQPDILRDAVIKRNVGTLWDVPDVAHFVIHYKKKARCCCPIFINPASAVSACSGDHERCTVLVGEL